MKSNWWDLARVRESVWLDQHWIYAAAVTVGKNVYWGFVPKSDGFPWEDIK